MIDAHPANGHHHVTAFSVVTVLLGLLLFVYTLERAGLREIAEGIRGVGSGGFLLILALSGIRLVVRSLAWTRCVEPPDQLAFGDAFPASVIGEALGNLTPFATFISEPSKAVVVRDRVPLESGLSAIVVENIYYTVSVAVVIAMGAVAFLVSFRNSQALDVASLIALGSMIAVVGGAYGILRAGARPTTAAVGWLERRGVDWHWLGAGREKIETFEERVVSFYRRHPAQLGPVAALEAVFHIAGIAETFVTLWLVVRIGAVTLVGAFILEATSRVVNVIFKFVPMRIGVDEAGAGLLAKALGIGTAPGVALAIIRKARILIWTAVGVLFLLLKGLSLRRTLREAEAVAEQE